MPDSPSVASRPNESELDIELAELVNWQRFATHLPNLTRGDIEQIEQDNRDVQRQKLELFGTWLRRCPNASWNNIVLVLEKSKQNTLADDIKMKFNIVISSDSSEAHDQAKPSSNQKVYLSSEKCVVEELKKLHRSFTSLARDIRCNLDELVKSRKSSLHRIAAFIQEARVCGIKGLTAVKTIDELFDAILPYNDYLDCELLEMIVEEYLDDDDITKVKAHIDKVKLFKCTAPIKMLKDQLQQYTSIPNISDVHLIVTIKLQADWGRVTLESIEKLAQNLLQYRNIVRIFKVESGSISVMLLLPKEKFQHFIVSSSQKLQFMRLTGIFRLQIGTITVFEESEKKNFTFESAFLESSQFGDDEAVQFLLDLGVNVNYSNSEGQTALIIASKSGQEEVVQTLLSDGANINHQDKYGYTALMVSKTKEIFYLILKSSKDINFLEHKESSTLMIACDLGHSAVVENLLLERNNDPNVQNKAGWRAIMFASRSGHLQAVELLLNRNADLNVQNNDGWTALLYASSNGHYQVVEILLKKFADPNINGNIGWTALIVASQNGHLKVVKLLLKKGVDPNVRTNDELTALIAASRNGHLFVVELLLKENADPNIQNKIRSTALIIVSDRGNFQLVEILLKEGADPNILNNDGATALMFASEKGHLHVVELLLNRNADPNVQSNEGWTALMIASQNGHLQIVNVLLEKKAGVNVHNNDGLTPIMFASQNGHLQVVALLLKAKTNPNLRSNDGTTALMIASQNGHLQIVEVLLKGSADPNVRNENGSTGLIFACHNGHFLVAERLLKERVDPNVYNKDGWTAVMFASRNSHHEVVELLLKAKADPNVDSNMGWTALLAASMNGNFRIIEALLQHQANPDVVITMSLDSFQISTIKGYTKAVSTLLNHAEISLESFLMGWYYACTNGHASIITLLSSRLDNVSNQTDLIISCAEGDLGSVVDQLMSGKMIPDAQFIHGVTPLMISSSCGHTNIAEAFIQSGANVNKTDDFGDTAIDYAEQAKQDTTRVLLLQHDGLHGIELGVKYETPEEPLRKTAHDITAKKDISNLQSPHSSRQRNISSIMRYLEDSIETHFSKHQSGYAKDRITTT